MRKHQFYLENNKIISVERLHELASDEQIQKIFLRRTVQGHELGVDEKEREFSHWELQYLNGIILHVYV